MHDELRFEVKVSRDAPFGELLQWIADGVERGLLKRHGHTLNDLARIVEPEPSSPRKALPAKKLISNRKPIKMKVNAKIARAPKPAKIRPAPTPKSVSHEEAEALPTEFASTNIVDLSAMGILSREGDEYVVLTDKGEASRNKKREIAIKDAEAKGIRVSDAAV